jgi:phospho-N-acetylmuramoyl-pentapeptide-transferase
VIRVLAAGVIAMIVSIVVGPKFIAFLRRHEFGQHIREEGPEGHQLKQGTPTMGGLLILVVATVAFLAVSKYKVPALSVLFVTLGCGAIGFVDDFIKLTHRRSLGLRGRWKLVGLALITVGVGFAADHQHLPTTVFIPVVHWNVQLSYGWYVLLFLVIAGTVNGVNLTDGIDGMAAGTGIIALITFTAISVVTYIRSGNPNHRFDSRLDLAIVGAALIGATIHHHFEMKAWSETKIMVRFWIVTAILCAVGFALFYRDFTFFRR